MKLAYITVMAPTGIGEKFVIDEINSLINLGHEVIAFPIRPADDVLHSEGRNIACYYKPLINFTLLIHCFVFLLFHPVLCFRIFHTINTNSHSIKNWVKNIAVVPKAIDFSNRIKEMGINHIHAHWETTTSTTGYICNAITGVPWSFSCHSGQILWNNMMEEKLRTASFCRVISSHRVKDVINVTRNKYPEKIVMIHMGVKCDYPVEIIDNDPAVFRIVCVANLDIIKGHRYLIDAVNAVHKQINNIELDLIGDGRERDNIEKQIEELSCKDYIHLRGFVDNSIILNEYRKKKYNLFVLPSICIKEEQREEGIPVSIMEAMIFGVPVISTKTGSIDELVDNGHSGYLVEDKNVTELADRIIELINDNNIRTKFILNARAKIEMEYSASSIAKQLSEMFEKYRG